MRHIQPLETTVAVAACPTRYDDLETRLVTGSDERDTAHGAVGRALKERAAKVLWCYAHAWRLARQGIWVVCTDEMPNLQVLERAPTRRASPGHIE